MRAPSDRPTATGAARLAIATLVTLGLSAPSLHAQACHGTPRGTSVAYERSTYQLGSANSAAVTFAGGSIASAVTLGLREYSPDLSGVQGEARFAVVIGSRFQVCPGLRLGAARDTWEYEPGSKVTGTTIAAQGGVNVGYDQRFGADFAVTPFAGVGYRFAATGFSIGEPTSESVVGGDTVSTVAIEYGLAARYRMVYAGYMAERTGDSQGASPDAARFFVGISITGLRGGPAVQRARTSR